MPEEYVQTMRASMLKRCPVSSYEQVCRVFGKDMGESPETVSSLPSSSLHYCLNTTSIPLLWECRLLLKRITIVEFTIHMTTWSNSGTDY